MEAGSKDFNHLLKIEVCNLLKIEVCNFFQRCKFLHTFPANYSTQYITRLFTLHLLINPISSRIIYFLCSFRFIMAKLSYDLNKH